MNPGFQIKAFYSPDNVEEQKILLLMYFTAIPQEILNLKKAGGRFFCKQGGNGEFGGGGWIWKKKIASSTKKGGLVHFCKNFEECHQKLQRFDIKMGSDLREHKQNSRTKYVIIFWNYIIRVQITRHIFIIYTYIKNAIKYF